MRRGRATGGHRTPGGNRRTEPQPAPTAHVGWADLSAAEQSALKRMNRGPCPDLDPALLARLLEFGLATERPQGIGISRAGRELVIEALLHAREEHDARGERQDIT
ncbi:hypothetical protein ACVCNR_12940 [Aquamicrobium terrae]